MSSQTLSWELTLLLALLGAVYFAFAVARVADAFRLRRQTRRRPGLLVCQADRVAPPATGRLEQAPFPQAATRVRTVQFVRLCFCGAHARHISPLSPSSTCTACSRVFLLGPAACVASISRWQGYARLTGHALGGVS